MGVNMEKSKMEEEYERYLSDPSSSIIINGTRYYRAVHIYELKNKERGNMVILVLPFAMFGNEKADAVMDERGSIFHLNPPAMIRFRYYTPRWHYECGTFLVKDADSKEQLGEYFSNVNPT